MGVLLASDRFHSHRARAKPGPPRARRRSAWRPPPRRARRPSRARAPAAAARRARRSRRRPRRSRRPRLRRAASPAWPACRPWPWRTCAACRRARTPDPRRAWARALAAPAGRAYRSLVTVGGLRRLPWRLGAPLSLPAGSAGPWSAAKGTRRLPTRSGAFGARCLGRDWRLHANLPGRVLGSLSRRRPLEPGRLPACKRAWSRPWQGQGAPGRGRRRRGGAARTTAPAPGAPGAGACGRATRSRAWRPRRAAARRAWSATTSNATRASGCAGGQG
jgi:hypothetical protein